MANSDVLFISLDSVVTTRLAAYRRGKLPHLKGSVLCRALAPSHFLMAAMLLWMGFLRVVAVENLGSTPRRASCFVWLLLVIQVLTARERFV